MKKLIGIMISGAMAAAMSMPAFAAENLFDIKCGEDAWAKLSGDGIMTISGTGYMDTFGLFDDTPDYPWQNDATSMLIENIVIEEGITNFDFVWELPQLKTMRLPDSITGFNFWEFSYFRNVQDKVFFSPYVDFIGTDTTLGNMTLEELENLFGDSKDAFAQYTCTFYAYKDTVWDRLADYGMKFHAMGDLDGNASIDITDAAGILKMYAGEAAGIIDVNFDMNSDAADINRDGNIDISDAAAALEYYASCAAGIDIDWESILQK
ncbi:MAG: hypothetical protein K2H01_10365 [Ruminococcus sp.]|nr:hypothetical protein [Ruminococcus sp.]